ncbi:MULTISPECIES: Panacea domain-containing protein [Campylobacter]|uniref:Panacea domain-containing protein n=1 Tax=Campylobacter TaxID=194 RepID=UPI000A353C19|nr:MULTISPECIES: Panacea domain-containing protein [unclassified Campylobacter]MCR8679553.1 Panacea domain-containing protein [Campylobacter sp. RM19072]
MDEVRAIIQALHYLIIKASQNEDKIANRMAILKLFFFAQRYHLRAYGRLIAKDKFIAMPNGPVASIALDIMKEHYYQILTDDKEYAKGLIRSYDKFNVKVIDDIEDYDELSETDKEALDFAIENFSQYGEWELVNFTHDYYEWKKHENELKTKKSVDMNILDFFSDNPENSPFECIPKEQVELNKKWFIGDFE